VFNKSQEFEVIAQSYEASGGDTSPLLDQNVASLVVSHNKILSKKTIPGVHIDGEETSTGAKAKITIDAGITVESPVHLCFGVIPKEGIQEIISEFHIGDGAKVDFLAHCSFPNALKVKHVMDAKIYIGKKAEMSYSETHYHGEDGGVEVLPVVKAIVAEGGKLRSDFKLIRGAVGQLRLDYEADLKKDAVCELDILFCNAADIFGGEALRDMSCGWYNHGLASWKYDFAVYHCEHRFHRIRRDQGGGVGGCVSGDMFCYCRRGPCDISAEPYRFELR